MTNEQCPQHYWVIDEFNVGHCKKCPAVKDFGALLNKEKNFVEKTRPAGKNASVVVIIFDRLRSDLCLQLILESFQ